MVTNPEPEAAEPTRVERVEGIARVIIGGDSRAAMRRIILYIVVAVALVVDGALGIFAGGVGLIALLLLAMTDQIA